MNQTECSVIKLVAQNVSHTASSNQRMNPECFADSCNIPSNMPTNFHLDPIATVPQRCLLWPYALQSEQSHLFRTVWCRRAMIPGKIFKRFAEFQGIVIVNNFGLPIRLQELLEAPLCLLSSFCLHGYAWIHWVSNSCTTVAYRWLFRDSQVSLRTLWSAVIKSPNFSARSTASPLRLVHGAIEILVLWNISFFWVPREVSTHTVLTQILTSLECGL